ncbi:hypothetical protein DPMN_194599 [Dreissena polymorpha]|uniref:Uncharacterized protein n=1 Tax=Dreissena polymorpha TaxID=45954 RepID=A0A9D4BFH8_DREPO|nr:hypothetical protein DPMN_194599 [Dreissena polymorpha]
MANSTTNTTNVEKLEEVTSFKYLGTTLSLWTSSYISFTTKYRLCKSLVVSILLYGCETWTLHEGT